MSTATLPDLFRTLGDPTRLRLLAALGEAELSVGELAEALGVAQSGVSRHLAQLKASGLVEDRREGTSSYFRVPQALRDERASAVWPVVQKWLSDLPDADADRRRLARVVQARRASEYFREVAPHWDSLRAAQYGEELRHLALLELIPRGLRVLDVGTGTGFMMLGVAPRVDVVIGVDASEAMLAQARENLALAGFPGADLRLGAMERLPVDDESVDVVLANMALHHAERPEEALAEFARVLRIGGRVVLTDLARHPHEWVREELADAHAGFTPQELKKGLASAGLGAIAVRPIGTCTLTRARTKERHAVEVLMATATRQRIEQPTKQRTKERSGSARASFGARANRGKR